MALPQNFNPVLHILADQAAIATRAVLEAAGLNPPVRPPVVIGAISENLRDWIQQIQKMRAEHPQLFVPQPQPQQPQEQQNGGRRRRASRRSRRASRRSRNTRRRY